MSRLTNPRELSTSPRARASSLTTAEAVGLKRTPRRSLARPIADGMHFVLQRRAVLPTYGGGLGPRTTASFETPHHLYIISHNSYSMPLVQTVVPESEYDLLRQRARKEGKPMKAVIREALRAHLAPDTVDRNDPVFHMFPLQTRRGKTHWDSRDHDDRLYPDRS